MLWSRSLMLMLLATSVATAGDWPQWLGPDRNGTTRETVSAWNDPPPVLWHTTVGKGHSSPVVAAGRVYLLSKVPGKEAEQLSAYDAQTGRPLWHTSYPRGKFGSLFGNGPRATPAVAEARVYTYGATGILTCFKADTGQKIWQVDTLAKFHAPNLKFGVSCSPLVVRNKVLVNVGAKGASVVAFDAKNGKIAWQSQDDPASYSSPLAVGKGGREQVVFVTGKRVLALKPADGRVFWQFPMIDFLSESSSTPVLADDRILVSSVTLGSKAYRIDTRDGKPSASPAWSNAALTCYFSTPVPVGRAHVYMVTGTFLPPIRATLRCVDMRTGKELWNHQGVGRYHAALLRTGNDKLLLMQDSGELVLLDPNPKGYRELARAKVCGESWAHPALADGKLYVRDEGQLICLRLRK